MSNQKFSPSRFLLKGFSHDQGFRQFNFEGIEEDSVRTQFMVRADLTLARTYGIHIQELPLLCREVLERRSLTDETDDAHQLTFTEDDMRLHRADRLAAKSAAADKRRPARRPSVENPGSAWRTTPAPVHRGA